MDIPNLLCDVSSSLTYGSLTAAASSLQCPSSPAAPRNTNNTTVHCGQVCLAWNISWNQFRGLLLHDMPGPHDPDCPRAFFPGMIPFIHCHMQVDLLAGGHFLGVSLCGCLCENPPVLLGEFILCSSLLDVRQWPWSHLVFQDHPNPTPYGWSYFIPPSITQRMRDCSTGKWLTFGAFQSEDGSKAGSLNLTHVKTHYKDPKSIMNYYNQ